MNRIRWYGPSVVLLVTTLLVMVAGPRLVEHLAWAQTDTRMMLTRDSLTQNPSLAELSDAFRKVSEVVEPSVVHIQISSKQPVSRRGRGRDEDRLWRFFHQRRRGNPRYEDDDPAEDEEDYEEDLQRYNVPRVIGNGSGWVYDHEGHIITNNHVVKDADEIMVRFHDGSESKATVVGTDPKTDIAVIKIDKITVHPATLAQQPVEQGNIVLAFGSPFGFEFSMSQGIVSAKGRRLGILSRGGYENFIQTDAAINRGNSGGPLTNIYGEVVGMNTAIATRSSGFQGLGFAIPIKMVRHVVEQLIDQGKVSRGYLGIYIADLNPKLANTFGFEGGGVLVEEPIEDGPADKGGIKRGDIITKINGEAVSSADELRQAVASHSPGSRLSLEVFRNNQSSVYEITIDELPEKMARIDDRPGKGASNNPPDEQNRQLLRKLGFESIVTLKQEIAKKINIRFSPGVFVRAVRPNSAAHAAGITSGQVITAVMGTKIKTVAELVEQLQQHDITKGVRMSIIDGDIERFTLLELPES